VTLSGLSILGPEAVAACCDDEDWKPLPGWPHEVSTCGRGRSITRIDTGGRLRIGQMLPQYEDQRPGKGYVYMMLTDGKRRRKVHVAVAVLEAHDRPKPGPGYDACHGNHVRTQNHRWNVFWDTHAGNVAASVQRRLEAVTDQAADTAELSQEDGFPWWRSPALLSQPSVTGDRDFGTGSTRFPSNLPSQFLSLNPLLSSLRTSFRSLRVPGRAA
jgi:hypothetical protein